MAVRSELRKMIIVSIIHSYYFAQRAPLFLFCSLWSSNELFLIFFFCVPLMLFFFVQISSQKKPKEGKEIYRTNNNNLPASQKFSLYICTTMLLAQSTRVVNMIGVVYICKRENFGENWLARHIHRQSHLHHFEHNVIYFSWSPFIALLRLNVERHHETFVENFCS